MKPGGKAAWVLLGCTLAAAVAATAWRREQEPEYRGRTLSAWLRAYSQPLGATMSGPSPEAADAVRHIGTNGLPLLVKWLEEDNPMPRWKERLYNEVNSWRWAKNTTEELAEVFNGPELRASRACWGFRILGPEARPAMPELVRMVNGGNEQQGAAAIAALHWVGPEALPALVSVVTNPARPVSLRASAARSIAALRMGAQGSWAVPCLTRYGAEASIAAEVGRALGGLGSGATPWLTQALQASRWEVRYEAAHALGQLGPEARAAAPALAGALADPNEAVRYQVTNALQQLAPGGAKPPGKQQRRARKGSAPAASQTQGMPAAKGSKRRAPGGGYEAPRNL